MNGQGPHSDPNLRAVVADIDRRRRARAARQRVATLAPHAAGGALLLALLSRWFGWGVGIPAATLVALATALGVWAWWGGRALPVSDEAAARIDEQARLGGELHSAHWFAGRSAPADQSSEDAAWAGYHLRHAAARIQAIDWKALYPPVQAGRQWMTSGALVAVAVIALVLGPRSRAAMLRDQGLSPEEIAAAMSNEMLPDDLQAKIDALLGEIGEAGLTDEEARLKMDELRDLLGKLDEAIKEGELAKGDAAKDAEMGGMKPSDDEGDQMAAKAENAAESNSGLPEDVRWSLEDLANRLANAKANQSENNKNNPSASEETGEKGNAAEGAEAAQMQQSAGMQMVREAASDAKDGQMMQGGGGAMGGDSRPGAGGNQGGQGQMDLKALAQALRQELIQAQQDQLGENIDTELRRKTEQSQAKVSFTRVPPPTTFDRSRAAMPPPVPEAHRSLLQRYFNRRQ